MPGHNFEKKVQEQLSDLHLQPSEAVWSGVEKEIRKDKRRRRMILWLPLLVLLLGGGLYWSGILFNHGPKSETVKNKSHDTKIPNDAVGADPASSTSIPKQNYSEPGDLNKEGNNQDPKSKIQKGESELKTQNSELRIQGRNESADKRLKQGLAISQLPQKDIQSRKDENPVPASDTTKSVLVVTEDDNVKSKQDAIPVADTPAKATIPLAVIGYNANPADSIKQAKKPPVKKSWQWGLMAGAGFSNVSDGPVFDVFGGAAMDDLAMGNSSGSPTSAYGPSATNQRAFGWSFGGYAQKQISPRLFLSLGLGYRQYSTELEVGAKIDSFRVISNNFSSARQVNYYYRNGSTTSYTNRFHFIELPVMLQLKINRSATTPIYWNTTLTLQQLLSTNALHYDGASGVYYQDNNLFNETQIAVGTGFSVGMFNKSKHPGELGPQFHYNLSNLREKSTSGSNHLLWLGIQARWYIKK